MIDTLLQYDSDLFLYLNNLGSQTWDHFWLVITNKLTFAPLYAILLYLIYKHIGLKPMFYLILLIALMITFTDQITNVFKQGFMRPRPCRAEDIMDQLRFIAPRCGKYGFFSGHSSNSMAAAVFGGLLLKPYYKNLIFFLLVWSFLVAYSRIYVGVHYPLDIVCGMAFGACSGLLFFAMTKQFILKRFNAL